MTKEQFNQRWDSDEITFEDIANCYQVWGLGNNPKTKPMTEVLTAVLKAAQVDDKYEV